MWENLKIKTYRCLQEEGHSACDIALYLGWGWSMVINILSRFEIKGKQYCVDFCNFSCHAWSNSCSVQFQFHMCLFPLHAINNLLYQKLLNYNKVRQYLIELTHWHGTIHIYKSSEKEGKFYGRNYLKGHLSQRVN